MGLIVGVPFGRWHSNPYLAWPFSAFAPKADLFSKPCGLQRGETHPVFLALHWRNLLDSNPVLGAKDIAENEGLTRARVDQVLRLTKLDQEILDALQQMPEGTLKRAFSEPKLRKLVPLPRHEQIAGFRSLRQAL